MTDPALKKICPKSGESCDCPKGHCLVIDNAKWAAEDGILSQPDYTGIEQRTILHAVETNQTKVPIFPHCTADLKCDEHFGTHWQSQRPVAWVLDLAKAALRLRIFSAKSTADWEQACTNAATLQNLLNAQWRDCVRKQGVLPIKREWPKALQPAAVAADYDNLFGEES